MHEAKHKHTQALGQAAVPYTERQREFHLGIAEL